MNLAVVVCLQENCLNLRRQINRIDVNFNLQGSLETFNKNSADKIWSNWWKMNSFMLIFVSVYLKMFLLKKISTYVHT